MLYASERSAARLLDMKPTEFRALVDAGALPRPVKIAGAVERWRVQDLDAILQGTKPKPNEEFDL
ncbi:helix-turn-helix transcriptional regulator [Falsirhodobacter sp. 20TX0035]|uniref:helix-turn-helix transcriptional regulator n=1 Tax=Falsirhodobacter sp. 20TX0035 TaxID=3022019 RepID=UPI00232E7230|nr:hypothetical protein [Falsirhodobacter sp. 20TX0035]MDB6455201.1 hypothetical protein [Falsirhodobacter sp. 20TX0035]